MFSYQLAIARLKALAPDRYADRKKPVGAVPSTGPVRVEPMIETLRRKLQDVVRRRQAMNTNGESTPRLNEE